MAWLQLYITVAREQVERIEDALLAAGAVSVTLEDNADQPILEPALGETPLWQKTLATGLFDAAVDTTAALTKAAAAFGGPLPLYRWEQLEDRDWEREWMQNYQPIQCGERFWICPSWTAPPDPEAVNLLLDPGLAFGTGTHPTTFLCLQWLAALPRQTLPGAKVVDYGCGSGVLGIAALLLGASQAMGVDIDPQALLASRENAKRNSLAPQRFPVYLPADLPPTEPEAAGADIVLANILAGPLAELAPDLTRLTRSGGSLCLSGILADQADAVMAAYQNDFEFNPPQQLQEWVCLTAIKRVKG